MEQDDHMVEEHIGYQGTIPTDYDAIRPLLTQRTNRMEPLSKEEISRAADLLLKFIHSPYPAQEVSEHLDKVDDLVLALLELNIKQAREDGRNDLAQALQNLEDNLCLQLERSGDYQNLVMENAHLDIDPDIFRIHFLCRNNGELSHRLILAAEFLSSVGCNVSTSRDLLLESITDNDIIIVNRPHVDTNLIKSLVDLHNYGNPIILDLDSDFEQMPIGHRDYDYSGLSTLNKSQAYAASLSLADQICVHSNYLASVLSNKGYRSRVIPEGWTNQNARLAHTTASKHALNLGWIGTAGQIDDISPFRRIIARILREFPQVGLVIGGDPDVYRLFDSIPESRRIFLPDVNYEYYPYLFSQIDILLHPLRKIAYNFSLSDSLLMEAGARGVPWIASPLPAAIAWAAGGIIVDTPGDWHSHLRKLILDQNMRKNLANSGRKKAEARKMNNLVDLWYWTIFDTWYKNKHQ